jgi:hypothetical protein
MTNERQIIYDLIDHLGGFDDPRGMTLVLRELIKSMTTAQIVEFVEHFAANHDVTIPGYPGFEEYELCMDCQDSYESNETHTCK